MNKNRGFWAVFSKRTAICFTVMLFLFFSCILRVAVTATSNYEEIRKERNSYKIKLANIRGTVYDKNMVPLTNNQTKLFAAVSPTRKAINALKNSLGDEFKNYEEDLNSGIPVVCEISEEIKCDGIAVTKIYTDDKNNQIAKHLIGYTNSENKGVTGLQAAYDDILSSNNNVTVYFESNGKGKVLEGSEPIIYNDTDAIAKGVVTTIDINIQNIAEKAALNIEKGAVVIADAKNGKIRASVSMPQYSTENMESSLNDESSPLLNRAINAYNVGSVFKPCVAISGIEKGISDYCYYCEGKHKIVDRYFKCHKLDGHKFMNLKFALANSCNTYFYNYAEQIGANSIYNTASSLNFGNSFDICKGITNAKGTMPTKDEIKNPAQLANFCIGQGKLTLSPIGMLTLYCSIANGGYYYIPSVIEGTYENGIFKEYDIGKPTKVMENETAKMLIEYLSEVLESGTGMDAKPALVSAAGKTATAQTGKYNNGTEISQGWFCGLFPKENPKYVAIIFSEDTKKQTKTCNEIFVSIADGISALND